VSSPLVWLDFSAAEQRKIRDVLQYFEEKGTVDDLGLGTIRDVFSNALFPGTSVIQTRARYFLFIPWILIEAQRRWPQQMIGKSADMERKLIEALRTGSDGSGLIGKSAGKDLKALPSLIYWAGLQTLGIFKLQGKTIRQFESFASRAAVQSDYEGEIVDQLSSYWTDLPEPPADFFSFVSADFNLTRTEADWLAERMISTSRSSESPNLLTEVVMRVRTSEIAILDADYVWDLQHDQLITESNRTLLFHAERFSLLAHGLSLIYNEMLCELRRKDSHDFDPGRDYLTELNAWSDEATAINLLVWCRELDDFWDCMMEKGAVIPAAIRDFLANISEILEQEGVSRPLNSHALREAIKRREMFHKRGQARFVNSSRLRAYQGQAGANRMVFRWDLARGLIEDIAAGYGLVVN
jgi:hypothetical protein